jgi:glycine/D-amino acid oxidase-like deaminating enzyme
MEAHCTANDGRASQLSENLHHFYLAKGDMMKIGIIGAGNIGSALARHFTKLHHPVLIANSRGPETLQQLAQETGAAPVPVVQAATGVDLLVITLPMKSIPLLRTDLLKGLSEIPIVGILAPAAWYTRILHRPRCYCFTRSAGIGRSIEIGAASRRIGDEEEEPAAGYSRPRARTFGPSDVAQPAAKLRTS